MIRYVGDQRVARFVSNQLGIRISPPYQVLGTEKDGRIVNGVLLCCNTGFDIEVNAAGHGWSRGFIREVGRHVFETLGCIRMSITTEQPNVVRYAERLGGRVEGMKADFYGHGRDAFLIGILRNEYRFLR